MKNAYRMTVLVEYYKRHDVVAFLQHCEKHCIERFDRADREYRTCIDPHTSWPSVLKAACLGCADEILTCNSERHNNVNTLRETMQRSC